MFKTRRGLLIILILFFAGWLPFNLDDFKDLFRTPQRLEEVREVTMSPSARQHILQGDERGGGHLFGTGKPCKSEFPKDWEADEIVTVVHHIAANDNLDWEGQDNGYYVAEETVDGVRVRVVINNKKSQIVTAYPVNVKRNPCPAPANDNDPQ